MSKPTQATLIDGIDYRIWVMMARALEVLNRARNAELTGLGISRVEALALFIIRDTGSSCTPAIIAKRMAREHSTVTALLSRMEKKGLVSRQKDMEKKRGWLVGMTDTGLGACKEAADIKSIHSAMSNLTDSEKTNLENYLKMVFETTSSQLAKQAIFPSII